MLYKGKKILITGGTGSLGQALTKRLLSLDVDTIRIFSRNESKQVTMSSEFNDERLRFFIGDVRDYNRLVRASEDVDIVFHAAALKHVPVIEYNPFEAIQTNVIGSQNVVDACIYQNVEKCIGIGTDKAVSPLNTYGATKLLMEKLFVATNNYLNPKKHKTKFIALRYGNVFGSSGSVIPRFINQIKNNQKITITDPSMTRFSITMNEALKFILESAEYGNGSEIFVPKLKAYSIMDVMESITDIIGNSGHEIIGIRPGEKMHETLINHDEIKNTWELNENFAIFPPLSTEEKIKEKHPKISKTQKTDTYSSDTSEMLTKTEIKKIIKESNILQ